MADLTPEHLESALAVRRVQMEAAEAQAAEFTTLLRSVLAELRGDSC